MRKSCTTTGRLPPESTSRAVNVFPRCSPLETARQRLAVETKLAEPGYMALKPVRDGTLHIIDFQWTQLNPRAHELLGGGMEFVGQQLLDGMPSYEEGKRLFEAYREVVHEGSDQSVNAGSVDQNTGAVVMHQAYCTGESVAVVLSQPAAMHARPRQSGW